VGSSQRQHHFPLHGAIDSSESLPRWVTPCASETLRNEQRAGERKSRSDGLKNVFWRDDSVTDGHALGQGPLTCGAFLPWRSQASAGPSAHSRDSCPDRSSRGAPS